MGEISDPNHREPDEIDTAFDFSVVDRIRVHHGAVSGIAAATDGSKLLVTNHADNSVSFIDTDTCTTSRTVTGTTEPFAVEVAGSRAYVSTASVAYDVIVVIDLATDRVVGTHPLAYSVRDLAVSPDGRHVYACRTSAAGADVAVIDTGTGDVDSIGLVAGASAPGVTTGCVRVSPDGSRLYVATDGPSGAELVVIDTVHRCVAGAVEIGRPIRDVALSPHGDAAYVLSCGFDFGAVLDVIDTGANRISCTGKIAEAGGLVTQLALSGDGERIYLVGEENVIVLGAQTHDVIGTIAVGGQPSCVVESADGNRLYVADYAGGVSVVAITSSTASPVVQAAEWALLELLQLAPAAT